MRDERIFLSGIGFVANESYYIFDHTSVLFFEVDKLTFDVFGELNAQALTVEELVCRFDQYSRGDVEASVGNILELLDEGLLKCEMEPRVSRFSMEETRSKLESELGGLILFLTSRCNLGCSYCIYGGDYHQHGKLASLDMPDDVIYGAIDFLKIHSGGSKELRFDFFGGEPMLVMDKIKKAIEYAEKTLDPSKKKIYSMVTNGTVLPEAVLDFVVHNGVALQFSLDGGEEIHDKHRKYKKSGSGSYAHIMDNLRRVREKDVEYFKNNIHIKSVIAPDTISDADLEFYNDPAISELYDLKRYTAMPREPFYDIEKDYEYFDMLDVLSDKLKTKSDCKTVDELISGLTIREKYMYHHTLQHFFHVQVGNRVHRTRSQKNHYRKSCLIGYEGAVEINGDICLCIKAKSFVVGNVLKGEWDYEAIESFESRRYAFDIRCNRCVAQQFCELCYDKLNLETLDGSRQKFCDFNEYRYKRIFQLMLEMVSRNPDLWDQVGIYFEEQIGKARSETCAEN